MRGCNKGAWCDAKMHTQLVSQLFSCRIKFAVGLVSFAAAGSEEWSWRVVAGQNAAYDQFPCQYQIFYRGKAKRSMWYDPVFQVSAPLAQAGM